MIQPSCPWGYTYEDLQRIFTTDVELNRFSKWMHGQTMMLCDGRRYDDQIRLMLPIPGHPAHGTIVYTWDVERYLRGLPIID